MKRVTFVGSLVVATIILSAVILLLGKGVEAVKVRINKKDFQEHGLSIITAADPSFDNLMSIYASRHPDASVEILKPFSFFIHNNTHRTVVAYVFKLECMKADGTVIDKTIGMTTLWALTNTVGDRTEAAIAHANTVIRPNTALFFSLAAPLEALDDPHISTVQVAEQEEELKRLKAEFAAYTNITVSIDGSFFDDGGFVGLDTTGFFNKVKAQVDARYEVLNGVQSNVEKNKRIEEVFKPIEAMADAPKVKLRADSTPEEYYLHEKKLISQELSNIKKHKGDDNALEQVHMRLNKKWPVLRKL